jgi:hypothetical protein
MAHTPNESAIRTDATLEQQIAGADFETIKEILHNAAVQQNLVTRDIYDQSVLLPTEHAAASSPQKYSQVVTIDGVKTVLESPTYEGLQQQVEALYRQVFSQPATQQQQRQTPARDTQGRFTAEQGRADENLAERVELELAFKRGDINAAEYLERSGAISQYLQNQGISVQALKAATEEREGAQFEKSWEQATREFVESAAGRDWVGGEEAKNLLGSIIVDELGAVDQPSAQTLARAWQIMKERQIVPENPETAIGEATSHEQIRELARRASGIFGGR